MEEQKTADCPMKKFCGSWCGGSHGHVVLRWVLGLIILSVVFWMGVKVGEFKSIFSEYGNGRGDHYYSRDIQGPRQNYPMMYNGGRGRGMMNGGGYYYNSGNVPQEQQKTAPTAPQE